MTTKLRWCRSRRGEPVYYHGPHKLWIIPVGPK